MAKAGEGRDLGSLKLIVGDATCEADITRGKKGG